MIIIPARLNSSRFDSKILAEISGVPMFIKTALNAKEVDETIIAVDDESVLGVAKKYGFKAVLTSKNHQSGTDRIDEVAKILGLKSDEIIINLQADEPFFEVENLKIFKDFSSKAIKDGSFMSSAYKIISEDEAKNPNLVKVVCDEDGFSLYFSRSLIPYPRGGYKGFKGHIGIYGYSVLSLNEFCNFKESSLEKAEKLEQLRALENSKSIKMIELKSHSIGIDTKDDLELALKKFGKS